MAFRNKIAAVALAASTAFLAAQDESHSTPMEIVHAKPFVMVTVNGKGPFRFLIDTGTATQVIVSPQLASELDLPRAGHAMLVDPSGIGRQTTNYVLIESLEVAGERFGWIEGVEHTVPDDDGDCEGLLGFGLFQDYLLTLDFPARRMRLATGTLAPDNENSVVPFQMPNGVPITTLHIGALEVNALIDSGGAGLSIPEPTASQLTMASEPARFGIEESLTALFPVKAARLAANVRLGRYAFATPFVIINPAFPIANFGASPMDSFAWTFDQENKLMRLDAMRTVFHLDAPPVPLRLPDLPVEKQHGLPMVPEG